MKIHQKLLFNFLKPLNSEQIFAIFFKILLFSPFYYQLQAASEKTQQLEGLVFTDYRDRDEPFEKFKGIWVIDLKVPDESAFKKEFCCFLNKTLSPTLLDAIEETVRSFYKDHNYPIIDIFIISPQNPVHFAVLLPRRGKITAKGAKYFNNTWIKENISVKKGEILQATPLLNDLLWINQNPFHQSDLIFEPSKDNKIYTDILVLTKDRFPVRAFAGYENTGNQIAGDSRFLAGVNWGKFFGDESQINYAFYTAYNVNKWNAHTASFILPFPWKNSLEAYGSYTKIKAPRNLQTSTQGKGWEITLEYKIPFMIHSFKNEVFCGYQFRRTNNFLTFDPTLIFDHSFDFSQFFLGYNGSCDYPLGFTELGLQLYVSPGKMTPFNRDKFFESERPDGSANYVYGKIKLAQFFWLPQNFNWIINAYFQESSNKLLPPEEFYLGGYATVRGYEEFTLLSDNGFLLKNEWRTPTWKVQPCVQKVFGELLFLAFVDYGFSYGIDPNVFSQNSTFLASTGLGARYQVKDYLHFRVDYGWQLHHIKRLHNPSNQHSRAHVEAVVAF